MKADNKQHNRDCNDKDAIIQALKNDTSKRIDTSLDENKNHIKTMTFLHRYDTVMKDQTFREQER